MPRRATLVLLVTILLCGGAALAESQPGSKATASIGKISYLEAANPEGAMIMANRVKTASGTDLFIDVSMECGLFTSTKVDSLGGEEDRAEAMSGVEVTVLVDGVEALPGAVTFCRRSQVLKAEFQGLLTDEDGNVCLSTDLETGEVSIDEDCLRPETLEMTLDTMGAHSFNYIHPNLTSGVHSIEVRARIDSYMESTLDSGAKVRDSDVFEDNNTSFQIGDTLLTVDKGGKFQVGQIIVIGDEKMRIEAIQKDGESSLSGKDITVIRGFDDTTEADHSAGTRIYIVDGADAVATIGNGSVTVDAVRMIKGEDIELN